VFGIAAGAGKSAPGKRKHAAAILAAPASPVLPFATFAARQFGHNPFKPGEKQALALLARWLQ